MKQHPGEGDDSPTNDSMRLLHETTVLDDESTLEKLELKDNSMLYLVYAVADDEYESVDVVSTALEDA